MARSEVWIQIGVVSVDEVGMTTRTFRRWDVTQSELFPPTYCELVGSGRPDHSTISLFRKTHIEALRALFTRVLALCRDARLMRQFLTRGLANVQAEWSLLCTAHNLLKLAGLTAAKPLPTGV